MKKIDIPSGHIPNETWYYRNPVTGYCRLLLNHDGLKVPKILRFGLINPEDDITKAIKGVRQEKGKYKVKARLRPHNEGIFSGRIENRWQYTNFIASFNWSDNLVHVVYLDKKRMCRRRFGRVSSRSVYDRILILITL
jgi:hypothetical protein